MSGLRPTPLHVKDRRFAFHRLFGATAFFPDRYNADDGTDFPNQNDDSRPTACTTYAVTEIGRIQDGTPYSRDYNLMKTFELMDVPPNTDGADARTAFKVPVAFGLLPATFEPPAMKNSGQAWAANQANWPLELDSHTVKKPAYLPIKSVPDYFDGIRSAILFGANEKRTVGIATRWSPDFQKVSKDGVLPESPKGLYWGHMYQVCGWKPIGGEPYLILKTWNGKNYADAGYCYMSRTLCNRLMGELGAYAATLQDVDDPEAMKSRQITLLESILALKVALLNLLMKVRYGMA